MEAKTNNSTLKVHSIETFGTHEGPGIRFVVFVQGCNYKCLYCHNPDTQPAFSIQQSAYSVKEYSIEELVEMAEKSRPYFGDKGGVTVTGGEPLLQAENVTELFKILKSKGIQTALDTNGSILNDKTKELLKYTDLVLLDIKHYDPTWHDKVTGTKCNGFVPSIKFLEYLNEIKKPVWIRYVFVPGLSDQMDIIKKMFTDLDNIGTVERIEILPYHTLGVEKYEKLGWDYKLKDVQPPTKEILDTLMCEAAKYKKKTILR